MITVVKRDGNRVLLDIAKIQRQVANCCRGIDGVSPSMIEIKAQIELHDGISTKTIDELLLKAMVNLVDETENPEINNVNYQYVAGRQKASMLRKEVYGQYDPPKLYQIVKKNIALGMYTPDLLEWYTEDEWNIIDLFIDHSKDENYTFAAIAQLTEKYLVQNRATGQIYETPQVRYAIAAATAFHAEPKDKRLKYVKEYYECASDGHFTLATPVLAGLGTTTKQFSSCVLISSDDTLDSIFAAGEMMAKYASKRAGIGLEIGRIRPLGAPIRNGEIKHTGMIPFLKKWFSDLRSCCVTPDTWVEVLDEQEKNTKMVKTKKIQIKDLAVGMKIKTKDETGTIVFKTVTDKWNTVVKQEDQVRLEFENGVVLNCSVNHPIMVLSESGSFLQKKPRELSSDDRVLTEAGFTRLLVADFEQQNDTGYIDITVEDTHMFFASASKEGPMVLTHNSQGGIRNASCTVFFPIWHYQFEDLIVLKNNQGTEETRVRQMDYGVVIGGLFWKRFKEGKNITLFDPHEVPDLYEAYYRDSAEFERLYLQYEQDKTKKKKVVSADEIFKNGILKERTDTGRIYLVNVDNVINQGPFDTKVDPIYQSNLCQEILLPTKPFQRIEDLKGRIALCTLGSINWGAFRNPQDMRKACRLLVRSLSNLLNYQDFLSVQSRLANQDFEPLGVGITNLAYWHAKRNLKYGESNSLAEVKRWVEHQAYYLTETSVELAEERGACGRSEHTWYGKGVFPWERRNSGVNELTDFTPSMNWEVLREKLKKYGIRNATLMAVAPVESSSVVLHSTNGIEMPMELISVKESKAGSFVQVVPEYKRLKNRYELMWDQKDCVSYLKTAAVLAAYIDQSLSTNTFYNPAYFKDAKVPATLIAKNLMLAYKWGIKTIYYSLINKVGAKANITGTIYPLLSGTSIPAVSISATIEETEDDSCESCKL